MTPRKQDAAAKERTRLAVTLDEARERVKTQLDRGRALPNVSINENDEARRWYDFTTELLRQIASTDELSDDFTGKSGFSFDPDISTGAYLKKLLSIYDRLELLPAPESSSTATARRQSPSLA